MVQNTLACTVMVLNVCTVTALNMNIMPKNGLQEYSTKTFLQLKTISNLQGKIILNRKEGRKEIFYLSTHYIYGYMASDIWLRTILIMRK